MRETSMKNIVAYILWCVVVASMWILKHYVLFGVCLLFTILIFAGIVEAFINRHKHNYLYAVDCMSAEEFNSMVVCRILNNDMLNVQSVCNA